MRVARQRCSPAQRGIIWNSAHYGTNEAFSSRARSSGVLTGCRHVKSRQTYAAARPRPVIDAVTQQTRQRSCAAPQQSDDDGDGSVPPTSLSALRGWSSPAIHCECPGASRERAQHHRTATGCPMRGPYRPRVRPAFCRIASSPVRCAMVNVLRAPTELAAGSAPS